MSSKMQHDDETHTSGRQYSPRELMDVSASASLNVTIVLLLLSFESGTFPKQHFSKERWNQGRRDGDPGKEKNPLSGGLRVQ